MTLILAAVALGLAVIAGWIAGRRRPALGCVAAAAVLLGALALYVGLVALTSNM